MHKSHPSLSIFTRKGCTRTPFFISLIGSQPLYAMNPKNETRSFYLSLRKLLPLLAGSIVFVGAGAWLILHAQSVPLQAAHDVIPAIGWLAILFFGTCSIGLLIQLVHHRRFPLVVVSPEGLRVNTIFRPAKGDFFPWGSIKAFRREQIAGNDLLAIHVRDLAQRYERAGILGKANISLSLRITDTPYTINDRLLDAEPGQLEHLLGEYLATREQQQER